VCVVCKRTNPTAASSFLRSQQLSLSFSFLSLCVCSSGQFTLVFATFCYAAAAVARKVILTRARGGCANLFAKAN